MNSVALTIRTDSKTKKVIADFAASVGLSTSAFATVILLTGGTRTACIADVHDLADPLLREHYA